MKNVLFKIPILMKRRYVGTHQCKTLYVVFLSAICSTALLVERALSNRTPWQGERGGWREGGGRV